VELAGPLAGFLEADQTWLVHADEEVVGTLTVDHDDPAWSDQPANAAYVHRMAVTRHGAALGTWLLAWVGDQAHTAGREAIRLDCVADNTGLCAYYERHGFRSRGDVRVGGAPGERRTGDSSNPCASVREGRCHQGQPARFLKLHPARVSRQADQDGPALVPSPAR